MYFDPLREFHTMLRQTQHSGYPNAGFMVPNPYYMAQGYAHDRRRMFKAPFASGYQRNARLYPLNRGNKGIAQRGAYGYGQPIPGMAR